MAFSPLSTTRPAPSPSATGCCRPRRARCRRTCGAPTRSTQATAPARAAARRLARATRSTRRDGGDAAAARRRQRDRLPRGVLHAISRDVVADPVDPLALRQRGRRRHRDRGRVEGKEQARCPRHCPGGDGGTTDIGFGCLSGMFERNDDVLYICYDNEAYMNTGVQRSSATPPAARTATTTAGNSFGQGKNIPLIAMAHGIPYVATATIAEPARPRSQGKARDGHPRRALHPHLRVVPARLGPCFRRLDPGRAAGEGDGALPGVRGRARRGEQRLQDPQAPAGAGVPAAAAKVRASLFAEKNDEAIARIQEMADRNIRRFGLVEA